MKDILLGIFLCLAGGIFLGFLQKNNVGAQTKMQIRSWIIAIALVVLGLYFLLKFFGVDF